MELMSIEMDLGRTQVAIRERRLREAINILKDVKDVLLAFRIVKHWTNIKAQMRAANASDAIFRALDALNRNEEGNPNRLIHASEYTTLAQLEIHSAEVAEGRR